MASVIKENDLKLKLTGNSLNEEYDLSNLKNEEEANKKVYVTNFDVSKINKNEIKLQVLLNNDPNKAQDYLVNKELNISVEVSDLKCVLKDTTPPTIEEFTVTGVTDNTELTDNKLYTHKNQVSYKLTFTDEDVESYCITENSSCNDGEWQLVGDNKTITNTLTLSNNNEGLKTINAFLKDKKGNVSQETKTITLDTSNPTATIKSNSQDTSSITVTVGYEGQDSIIKRQCRLDTDSTWTDSKPDGSCTISDLKDGKEYTIKGRVRDASGRWNTTYPNVSVTTQSANFQGTGKQLLESKPKGLSGEPDCQGMYRFVGTKDDVNNYVCFGYTNISQCSSGAKDNEYIYRIIGINSNGEIKLIKNKALSNKYLWFEPMSGLIVGDPWPQSEIFKSISSDGFLTGLLTRWQEKIVNHSWPTGIIEDGNAMASTICETEKGLTSISAKVGLMTLSDYYYAAGGGESSCFTGVKKDCSLNWMFFLNNGCSNTGDYEWTMISADEDILDSAYAAGSEWVPTGSIGTLLKTSEGYVRPVFYLSPVAVISSGSGTSTDPFIIDLCDGDPSCDLQPDKQGPVD